MKAISTRIHELAEALAIPSVEPDEGGALHVASENERIVARIEPLEEDTARLVARIGQCRPDQPQYAAVCENLLETNLGLRETRGATLAIQPNTGEIYLFQQVTPRDLKHLHECFFAFFDVAQQCAECLARGDWDIVDSQPPSNEGGMRTFV